MTRGRQILRTEQLDWVRDVFRSRNLPVPLPAQVSEWHDRSPTDDVLLETVYGHLKRETILIALSSLGIDAGRLSSNHLSTLVSRTGGGIIDHCPDEVVRLLRQVLSDLLFEEVGEEFDPVVRFTLLTRDPWRLYAIALSGLAPDLEGAPFRLDRPIALGVERMMADHGTKLPRKELLSDFKKARDYLREEKKRVRLESEKERQREQHFHAWVRTLWTDREVRRELGLRPSEFEEWVARGRIPVVLRIESIRNGKIREKRLFDPETVLKISPATIARWRRGPSHRARQEDRRSPGGRLRPRGGQGRDTI